MSASSSSPNRRSRATPFRDPDHPATPRSASSSDLDTPPPSSSSSPSSSNSGKGGQWGDTWQYISLLLGLSTLIACCNYLQKSWTASLWYAFLAAYLPSYLEPSPFHYGRRWDAFCHLKIWKWYVGYLQGKVILMEPLDSNKQYMFAAHPHGITTWNHFITMTNGARFLSDIYPKERRDLGATILFFIPFVREILLWLGNVDAGASTANKILKSGYSTLIYIGGEKEQILTQRGRHIVVVKPRKGFLRLAMKYGVDVVPVYAWGENDLYFTFDYLKEFQLWLAATFRIAFPPAWGFIFPWVPLPVPVTVVMGKPLKVTKMENPSKDEVDVLHQQYMWALTHLFDSTKAKYGGEGGKNLTLEIR